MKGRKKGSLNLNQICPQGHNVSVSGRFPGGQCVSCDRERKWNKDSIINFDGSPFTAINYDRAYQIQLGRCLGCKKHQTEFTERLVVDHNHITKIFRGLLCRSCNLTIGTAKDNSSTLINLANYLEGK